MPLDPNIAMGFRLPQTETPFQHWGNALTLRNQFNAAENSELERQRRIAFDKEIQSLPESQRTTENYIKIASKYVPAKELYQEGIRSQDKNAQINATMATNMSRISEAHRMNDARIADMFSKTQDQSVRTRLMALKQANDAWAQRSAAAARDINTYYNTGNRPDVGMPPDVTGALMQIMGSVAPQQPTPQGIQNAPQAPIGASGAVLSQAPDEASALAMGQALMNKGRPFAIGVGYTPEGAWNQTQPPVAAPSPAPTQQPMGKYWSAEDGESDVPPTVIPKPGQGVPVARAQAEAQPAKPEMPNFTGSPREVERARNKWLADQSKASIAGGGIPSPQTLEFMARQYLTGDRQVVTGFARSAPARIAIQEAIVAQAQKQGMTPEQTAAQIADFAGTMAGSRTVGQRAANISLAATEAQEMLGIVRETSGRFERTNFVPWNRAIRAYETNTGSPEIAEFGAALNALVNVYARAINPTGVPTISDKEHARAVINTVQSPAQVEAVLNIINRELEIAKKAPRAVQEATRQRVTGASSAPPPPPGFKLD